MSKSNIEWTQETWNPITGCTKYSEGCKNCYACTMTKRLKAMRQEKYAAGFDKVVFHPEELRREHRAGNRQKHNIMIFVNSMSDTFHKNITHGQINAILTHCELWNENNIFQILTKRSDRLKDFSYPENVWLGVTVEKADYKFRIDDLRKTDAKIKFLSCEPLLSDLGELDLTSIDWVICGGESGPNARPMDPVWVRNIQRQCQEQNVPFFFKQWGEWVEEEQSPEDIILPAVGYGFKTKGCFYKVGKKKAGSLLDGKSYKEYPKTK
jgi:protein gp37